jgi:cbb3-type cytochrome oxidase subunit 3
MTYETLTSICQLLAMGIFGAMMLGILIHVLRPSNKARFEQAARLALRDDNEAGEVRNGR